MFLESDRQTDGQAGRQVCGQSQEKEAKKGMKERVGGGGGGGEGG